MLGWEPVAQLVEQRPFKAWVVRSSRTGLTICLLQRIFLQKLAMREWWNWQTHHLEGVAPVRACEFKSRLAHQEIEIALDFFADDIYLSNHNLGMPCELSFFNLP